MSKLVKDIVDVCLKEDLQKVLQKTTELKEMSAFGREFAQQMRQKGEGGVYRSNITGQNIRLQYANKAKPSAAPIDKISPSQYNKEREMAKQNMAPVKTSAAPKPAAAPAPKPAAVAPKPAAAPAPTTDTGSVKTAQDMMRDRTSLKGRLISPSDSGITSKPGIPAPDYSFVGSKKEMRQGAPMPPPGSPVNAPVVSGVRDFGANPPSSLTQTSNAPTPEPKPEPTKTSGIPSAADQMKAIEATPKPDSYVPKAARIGREPAPINESFVNVGSNKYRII